MRSFISEFGLTFKQTCLLFALERQIVKSDIVSDRIDNKWADAEKKQLWLDRWDTHINNFLSSLNEKNVELIDISTIDIKRLYENIISEDHSNNSKIWKYLILLECTLFTPYYSFAESKNSDERFIDKIKKIFDGLSLNKNTQKTSLRGTATLLNIDLKYINIFKDRYQEALRSLSGFWTKVLLAGGAGMVTAVIIALLLINPIAGMFAAPGLVGIAAFNSGLAALGGGAIAAGGFGIAGGIAVLVGGALIIGGCTGVGISTLASTAPQLVLSELAKMEVVLKEIVVGVQKDMKLMQEIILQLHNNLNEVQNEMLKLKLESEKNKEKIKNLEEAVEYMKKAVNEFTKIN